jgi:hypothetical protein
MALIKLQGFQNRKAGIYKNKILKNLLSKNPLFKPNICLLTNILFGVK